MTLQRNTRLFVKLFILAALVAVLAFLFHPDIGQLQLTIDGEPVADPLARFGVMVTLLLIGAIFAVVFVLFFIGVGVMILIPAMFFGVLGLIFVAPYFWPVFLIIVLISVLTLFGNHSEKKTITK